MKKTKAKRSRFRLILLALLILIVCIAVVVISTILQNKKSSYKSRAEGVQSNNEIINGYDAKPSEWPFVVRLILRKIDKEGRRFDSICTGSFISKDWLITAAHCLGDREGVPINHNNVNIDAYVDPQSDKDDLQRYGISVVSVITPNGSFPKESNLTYNDVVDDIALVKISNKDSAMKIDNLPFISYTDVDINNELTASPYVAIAGWGIVIEDRNTSINPSPGKLQESHLYVAEFNELIMALIKRNSQGIEKVGGGCGGDSGGPIVAHINGRRYLVGITVRASGSQGQCGSGTYALNIRRFSQWIEDTTGVKPSSGTFTRNLPILPPNDRDMWWIK